MHYRQLGRSGLRISELCLGTMNFGSRTPAKEAFDILNRAVDAGINFIDTADQYGGGAGVGTTESIIGQWLAEDKTRRDKLIIATKVHEPMSDDINDQGLSARHIQMACDASLKRLGVDHIDLYQMHHLDRAAPWDEVWQAMETLVAQGKITYVGSSNFAGWTVAQANEAARSRHFLGLVSEQSLYNLTERTIELEVIPACESYGLGLLPWSPLGGGIRQHLIETGDETRARLLYIPPGEDVPQHTHQGLELTLVLAGSFADGDEEFHVGDIEVADETVDHTPVSGPNGPCICLAVTDAPLVFRRWLPRMIQRFAKI